MTEYKRVYLPVCIQRSGHEPLLDEDVGDAYLDKTKAKTVLDAMVDKQWGPRAVWEDERYMDSWHLDEDHWLGWLEERNLDEELLE